MMTVPMDSSTAPSSRELAQSLFKKNIELENALRRSAQSKVPSDPNTWLQMRENYETIILEDHEFSEKHEVEYLLWQLHYRRIDEYRQRINAATAAASNASSGGRNIVRPDRIKKIRSGFKVFLTEATGFYHELMLKIRAKYGLPLSYLTEGPEILNKDEKKSTEMKKGLVSSHRCFIYLGDLARYKGIYGEGDSVSRDYAAASSYYMQAASLCPSNGNPHHQLAILASYSGNELLAVYRYFRSLAVEVPFSTARDNLITAFEKNRVSFSELPDNAKLNAGGRPLYQRSAGRGRGKGDTRFLAKNSKTETPSREKELNMSEVLKAFCTRFVRLNGVLFTRTSLETFGDIFSSVNSDLHVLLSSGPEEKLNFGPDATENALAMLRYIAILIFTVHNVKREPENQSYAEILQRTVLLQNAFTAVFKFAGYIVKRCAEINDAASSYLLPAILVFIEWLACHPDISGYSDADEKQAGARSFFWTQCVSFFNKLIQTGLASIDGDKDESCFFNMSRYDEGETVNRIALWEDFELRGFFPLVPAQLILDFSRKESYESDGSKKFKRSRVQRILAAGRSLTSVVLIDQQRIYIDPNTKIFVIGTSPPAFNGVMDSSLSSTVQPAVINQVTQAEMVDDLGITQLQVPNLGGTQMKPHLLVEEEEEEEIVFKPTVPEKHTGISAPISAAYEFINPVQASFTSDRAVYAPQATVTLDSYQISTAMSGSAQLYAVGPSIVKPPLLCVSPDSSKWLMKQEKEAFLSDGLKNISLMENGFATDQSFHESFSNVRNAANSSLLSASSNLSTISNLSNHIKPPEVRLPSTLDDAISVGLTSESLALKLPATLPGSKKNPVSRPARHYGPPPGFGHVSKQQNEANPFSVGNVQHPQMDDYSWLDGYKSSLTKEVGLESSLNQSTVLSRHLPTNGNIAFSSASSFPFPGKQVSDVQTQVVNEQKWKDFQLFEQLKPYAEKQLQQANSQQALLPEPHQAQSLWSGRYFV